MEAKNFIKSDDSFSIIDFGVNLGMMSISKQFFFSELSDEKLMLMIKGEG